MAANDNDNEAIDFELEQDVWEDSSDDGEEEIISAAEEVIDFDDDEEEEEFDDDDVNAEEQHFDNTGIYTYMGGWNDRVPRNVIRARVHPSVAVLHNHVFAEREMLEEVGLCEGLLEIGEDWGDAFKDCLSLRRTEIPSTVTIIQSSSFEGCINMEEVEFNEGLQTVEKRAFMSCYTLKHITLPSTIRQIGAEAFSDCELVSMYLPDGIESIGDGAFQDCNFTNFRIPPRITTIQGIVSRCKCMFSLEIPEGTTQIGPGVRAFSSCKSLRNIAIPPSAVISDDTFDTSYTDMQQLFFGHGPLIVMALKHRFNNLPIHKMLYYQSYQHVTLDQLAEATSLGSTGRKNDCLGMTTLHILACSTVQRLELYQLLVEKYPENLITEDHWGALPILYALWGSAPREVVHFLIQSYQSLYPNYELNWTKMVETLGRTIPIYSNRIQKKAGMTPLHILACSSVQNLELYQWALPIFYAVQGDVPNEIAQFLVESYRSLYPNYEFDWTKIKKMPFIATT